MSVPALDRQYVIKQYCGLRAHSVANDFEIGWSDVENFYNVAGIESPGLSAAPAVALKVASDLAARLMPEKTRALQAKEKGFFVTPRRRRRRDAKKRRKIRFTEKSCAAASRLRREK